VEIEQLGEKQVVQDLYALTRALTHLADRVAWLAILRAPWCGLTLDELSEVFEGKDKQTIWELMQEAPYLARMRELLAPALADRLRGTLRDRVEGVWLALGGPACVDDATDLEDAEIFLDELERLEEAGELTDFSALASSLEDLYALPDVNAGVDAVEIMTIHKAKGLEFDTVIVPGLDRPPRSGRKPLFAFKTLPSPSGTREHLERSRGAGGEGAGGEGAGGEGAGGERAGEKGLLLAPIDETGGEKEPLYRYVRDLDKEAEDIEAGRLLYVAATRAESRLHLLACLKVDEDGVMKMPSKRSLLGLAWRALSSSISLPSPALAGQGNTWGGAEGEGERERASLSAGELHRLPADFEMPEAPEATEWKVQEEGREEEQVEFSWVGETARHMGTVVHAWLHRIADDELKGWDTARVARARAAVRGQLSARGVSGDELQAATERVLEALRNSITDQKGRWVLGPHSEAYCEYRIRTRDRSYVIDRLIRDANGTRWLVDYKTSRHEGADIEGFLDREQKRYAAQLDAYAAALGGASRGLYFPLHAGWREW
jgi:ATP-dependent exoDNAse (exonuclease V) beta subunit